MAVTLAVGRHVDDLRPAAGRARTGPEQTLARSEQPLEGDAARDLAVVEEDGDGATRAVAVQVLVGDGRVDAPVGGVLPRAGAGGAHGPGLEGREDDVAQPLVDERRERRVVAGRLGEPERLGLPAEAAAEVGQPPAYLRAPVALVAEREDRVVVALRDGVAVAAVAQRTLAVGLNNPRVGLGLVAFEPVEERRAEVEAESRVVVDDALDAAVRVADAREGVRAVALGVDALVPVVEGRGARLALDQLRPGVLARRLVEVAVNDQRGRHLNGLLRRLIGKSDLTYHESGESQITGLHAGSAGIPARAPGMKKAEALTPPPTS